MSKDLIAEANRLADGAAQHAPFSEVATTLRALAAALEKAEAELAKAEWWNVADDPERSVEDPHDLWAEGDAGLDDVIQFWGARSTGCVWAAQIVLTWHDGEPDDVDVQTFQTKDEAVAAQEAARATLAQAQGGGDE